MAYYRVTEGGTGIIPTGKLNITDTAEKDVTNYAKAQVVDANLVAGNIKNGVNILGVTGSYSGGGASLPANIAMGTFVVASRTQTEQTIPHGLGSAPTFAVILADTPNAQGTAYTILGGCTSFDLNGGVEAVGTPAHAYTYGYNGVRREIGPTNAPVTTDATNIYISGAGNYYLDPTLTYRWIAWAAVPVV